MAERLPSATTTREATAGGGRFLSLLFSAAILLAAALLFLVEPMAAKLILPRLGGSPSVWNGCMLFFQVALLGGYGYAHLLSTRLGPKKQVGIHAGLLLASCLVLPLAIPRGFPDPRAEAPLVWMLVLLAVAIGFPFVVLAATGPLVQRWLSRTNDPGAKRPYFLYAASNVGSIAGLLFYPLVLEPALPLVTPGGSLPRLHLLPWSQSTSWAAAYVTCAALVIASGLAMLRRPGVVPTALETSEASPPTLGECVRWMALAAIPASLVLGATQFITSDVAVVPLFWVVPLAAYLLSFALAFSRRTWLPERFWGIALAVLAVAVALSFWTASSPPHTRLLLNLHPLVVLAAGMVCHRRLASLAPAPRRLTEFYLCVATGGVLGGAFNTIVAPVVFPGVVEYPLAILAACWLIPGRGRAGDKRARILDVALPAALAAFAIGAPILIPKLHHAPGTPVPVEQAVGPCLLALAFVLRPRRLALALAALFAIGWSQSATLGTVVHRERTFFGVLRVIEQPGPVLRSQAAPPVPFRSLFHGTTRHGTQGLSAPLRNVPTSYYHRTSPIGQLFAAYDGTNLLDRVALIGLGAGTLAAYGEPGRSMEFYEIDPAVVRIARDPSLFTFVADSRASLTFRTGDGRLGLERAADGSFGLIVVDAFSSDAPPVHLLTREALAIYFRKLQHGGVIALNLTNNNLDLALVVDALVGDAGVAGLIQNNNVENTVEFMEGKAFSQWAVIARDRATLAPLARSGSWTPLPMQPGRSPDRRYLWTDDYSSIFAVAARW